MKRLLLVDFFSVVSDVSVLTLLEKQSSLRGEALLAAWSDLCTGKITPDYFWQQSGRKTREAERDFFASLPRIQEVTAVFSQLHKQADIVLVAQIPVAWENHIKALPLAKYCAGIISTGALKSMNNSPAFFKKAQELSGVYAKAICVDARDATLKWASDAGCKTILLNRSNLHYDYKTDHCIVQLQDILRIV